MGVVKEGYKATELGVIPEDWVISSFGEIFTFLSTSNFSKAQMKSEDEIGCLHYGLIHAIETSNYDLRNGIRYYVSEAQARTDFVHDGDVVMVDASEDFEGINKSVEVCGIGQNNFISGLHTYLLRDKSSIICDNLRGVILNSTPVKNQMLRLAVGMKVYGVSKTKLLGVLLPIPTLEEQKAIATALSDVDELIESLERLIEKKKAIKQGMMQELFSITDDWEATSLHELASNKRANFNDGDWVESEFITDKGVRLIQTGNIELGKFRDHSRKKYISDESYVELKCKEVKPGDLLICRLAEPAGRACVLLDIGEYRMIASVDISIFRGDADAADRDFLSQFFTTKNWLNMVNERVGGTTHKRISRSSLGEIGIMIPSISLQRRIAEKLLCIDEEIHHLKSKRSKYQAIKQGMMQELLTGKTRLI